MAPSPAAISLGGSWMWIACVAVLATGCAEAHGRDDARVEMDGGSPVDSGAIDAADGGRLDARAADSGEPDAPCLDLDGDGFSSSSCGGEDCDDADASLSPLAGACANPLSAHRCVDGIDVVVACTDPTPECDARLGRCVAAGEACGDAVLHPSEVCDGTELCTADCVQRCYMDLQCPPSAPWCAGHGIDDGVPDEAYCIPGGPGTLPLTAPCSSDEECASGWCSAEEHRCTRHCTTTSACSGEDVWCAVEVLWLSHPILLSTPPVQSCQSGCYSDRDCVAGSGTVCTMGRVIGEGDVVTSCRAPSGSLPDGSACTRAEECAGNHCYDGLCTRMCERDDDCAPTETCTPVDIPLIDTFPTGWREPRPLVCRPSVP